MTGNKENTGNTIIIHPHIMDGKRGDSDNLRTAIDKLDEITSLSAAINLSVKFREIINVRNIRPATFIGAGKVADIKSLVEEYDVSLVIFDSPLSPIQQRNLEREWKCKVIDRTALILEIFGERAQTREGTLQVELAALEYQKSRLVRSWTHLERQRGGFGFMGGPGEKQIESDRRIINDRIVKIKKQLEKVKKTRGLHRKSRKDVPYPVVALVGYTNAGKSTLFNKLTGADVLAEDALFATLDPTMRMIKLPSKRKVILSDTVGFISNLPTELVAAFRATLEEVIEADLILHVRDISSNDTKAQRRDVIEIVESLTSEEKLEKNAFEVLNKSDLLEKDELLMLQRNKEICISALNGDGCDELLIKIDEFFAAMQHKISISIPASDGKALSWIYSHAEGIKEKINDDMIDIEANISDKDMAGLEKLLVKKQGN